MTKLVEFVLVPTVGVGAGHAIGNLVEADIIQRYVKALSDELDSCSVRHRVGSSIHPFEFVIKCGLGFYTKPPSKQPMENTSRTYMGQPDVNVLACLITEGLSHWGRTYCCHGHRSSKPVVDGDDESLRKGNGGIRLEPFVLNGSSAAQYAQRLEELGRDIGRIIADYVIKGNHGANVKPHVAADMMPVLLRKPF